MKYYRQAPLRHVGDVTAMGADRYGEKLALEYRGEEYSYADLDARANRVASALTDRGVGPGDRVALYIENSLQFPETFFGVLKAGAVAVPLNHRMDVERLTYILGDAEVSVLVASAVFPSVVKELAPDVPETWIPRGDEGMADYDELVDGASAEFDRPDRELRDVALQCYTSGTTGDPKGVLTTHRNLLATTQSYTSRSGFDPEDDVALLVLPLFHMYGLSTVMLTNLYNGATVLLKTLPVAQSLLSAITEHEVTSFAGIPAIFVEMVTECESNPEAYDLSSIESVGCGAAPLADDTRRRIEVVFDTPLVEGWGMTETTPAGTTGSAYGVTKAAGCIGQPVPDMELRLVDPETREVRVHEDLLDPTSAVDITDELDFADETNVSGEMVVRGPQVFAGYYGLPDKNREVFGREEPSDEPRHEDEWFYTGDIARADEDRFLWMVDRKDDMLIVGGENVYPAEVENALFDHPDVEAAAVVAAPHEVKGEAPVAFVVRTHDADPASVTEEAVRRFVLERVPCYAHPRRVFFIDELPRSGTQKVQRYKLEEEVEKRLDGPLRPSERL
jgi:long-chain acyl-CoA synthetase